MREGTYDRRAIEVIEALTPPPSFKMPNTPEQMSPRQTITKNHNRELSLAQIRKRPNHLEKNISMFNCDRHATPYHKSQESQIEKVSSQASMRTNQSYYIQVPQTIRQESITKKQSILGRLQDQYRVLKSRLNNNSSEQRRQPKHKNKEGNKLTKEQFINEIRTKKIKDGNVQRYADLYMLKKRREQVIKTTLLEGKYNPGLPLINETDSTDQLIEQWMNKLPEQRGFFQQIQNSSNKKRKKAIQQRGYLSNAYYEIAALNESEKRHIRETRKIDNCSPFKDLI